MTAPDDAVGARLGAMRERSAAATAGPWEAETWKPKRGRREGSVEPPIMHDGVYGVMNAEDAEFIAASRTDVDDLLGAVEDVLGLADHWERRGYELIAGGDTSGAALLGAALGVRGLITKRLGGA